ncbi:MAG: hypothetical protein ACYSWP_14965 [Planctomycetota bacterium]
MTTAYKLKVRRRGQYFIAFLTARIGKDASITVRARVAISAIAKILKSTYEGRMEVGADMFSNIWKSAKRIAKKAAQSKALRSAVRLLRSPDLKKISSIISRDILAPALMAIRTTLKAAKYYRTIDTRPRSRAAALAKLKLREAVQVTRRLQAGGDARANTLANALRAGRAIAVPKITIQQRPIIGP